MLTLIIGHGARYRSVGKHLLSEELREDVLLDQVRTMFF